MSICPRCASPIASDPSVSWKEREYKDWPECEDESGRPQLTCPNCGAELVGPLEASASGITVTSWLGRAVHWTLVLFALPGLSMQLVGAWLAAGPAPRIGIPLLFLGTLLLGAGLALYAKMRGRSVWWGLSGLLNCLGLLTILALGKRCIACKRPVDETSLRCGGCGTPAAPHK